MNRIDGFITNFRGCKEISLEDIFEYFHAQGKNNDKSIRSLITRWTKQGILSRVKKGTYVIQDERKKLFKLSADKTQKELVEIFQDKFPELKYAVWNTSSLNNLMVHQHFSSFYIFETESDILESLFYMFKDNGANAFIANDEDILQRYMYDAVDPVVIKRLITRSPVAKKEGITHPTLEKILVDVFTDRSLFNFAQGAELVNIYTQAFNKYVVNITKLLNYADRRKAKEEIATFIKNNIHNPDIIALL